MNQTLKTVSILGIQLSHLPYIAITQYSSTMFLLKVVDSTQNNLPLALFHSQVQNFPGDYLLEMPILSIFPFSYHQLKKIFTEQNFHIIYPLIATIFVSIILVKKQFHSKRLNTKIKHTQSPLGAHFSTPTTHHCQIYYLPYRYHKHRTLNSHILHTLKSIQKYRQSTKSNLYYNWIDNQFVTIA